MSFIKNECGVLLLIHEGMNVSDVISVAETVEKLGYGYVFCSDHFFSNTGKKGPSSECWVSLGAVAARTSSLKFGPLVSPVGLRNPAVLARMAWTLHTFSPGRLQLGLGAGWFESEYRLSGIDFPPLRVRYEQLDEALKIIRPFTQGKKVDLKGKYFSAVMEGHPKEGKVHLIVGGNGPTAMRIAARYSDELNMPGTNPQTLKQAKDVIRASDRDIELSQMVWFKIGENDAEIRARVRAEMKMLGVAGDDDAYIEKLRGRGGIVEPAKRFADRVNKLRESGVEKFYFRLEDKGDAEMLPLLADVLKGL